MLNCGLVLSLPPISVMSFIEKSVARLDQQDRLEALAQELGKSHYHYSAPPKYYSVRPHQPITRQRRRAALFNEDLTPPPSVRWSRIHQCCPAHPEGAVDGRAGGGLEGEKKQQQQRPRAALPNASRNWLVVQPVECCALLTDD